MDTRSKQRMRLAAVVLSVLALAFADELPGASAAASSLDPWCDTVCTTEAPCDLACWDGLNNWSCGTYQGGASEGHCDAELEICDAICNGWVSGEQECWWAGDIIDCEEYGEFLQCGDGVCAFFRGEMEAEDSDNCPEDCGAINLPTCGSDGCEPGETWMNCPADCPEAPPSPDECPDDVCSINENVITCPEDCVAPPMYCDGSSNGWLCPSGYTCVFTQCVHENYLGNFQTCEQNSDCGANAKCRDITWNGFPGGRICLPWYFTS